MTLQGLLDHRFRDWGRNGDLVGRLSLLRMTRKVSGMAERGLESRVSLTFPPAGMLGLVGLTIRPESSQAKLPCENPGGLRPVVCI